MKSLLKIFLSTIRWACICIFLLPAMHVNATEFASSKALVSEKDIVWTGVEVVTNDDELSEILSNLTKIHPGDLIRISDPRLKQACNNVRAVFPRSYVNCRAILMDHATSLYVVEFSLINAASVSPGLECDKNARIDPQFTEMYSKLNNESEQALMQKDNTFHEFVNTEKYLDNSLATLHQIKADIHYKVKDKSAELAAATKSCNVQDQAVSIQLMNYAGNPEMFIRPLISLINHPDDRVRNNVMRFLSVFSKFIDDEEAKEIAKLACTNIAHANFLDRNKGVSVIWSMVQKKPSHRTI